MSEKLNSLILDFACRLAEEAGARAILLYSDICCEPQDFDNTKCNCEIILVSRGGFPIPERFREKGLYINIPQVNLTRMGEVKIAITKGIAAGLLSKGDKVVCLTGLPKLGYIDTVLLIDVGREFEILTSDFISGIFDTAFPEVFEAVLNIAVELGAQGREGRPVGTIFVIGDHEKVLQFSRQMIINPFKGYAEEERNVLNPALKETIKEFSALDGAFIIKDNGVLVSAGTYLNSALESREFPKGLGSRHIAAAGVTGATDSIAIVVSETAGTVRVFKKGKVFVSIEKPVE
jgi:DNA integrity scanning protein DisA with diadenylate cyclase activity